MGRLSQKEKYLTQVFYKEVVMPFIQVVGVAVIAYIAGALTGNYVWSKFSSKLK